MMDTNKRPRKKQQTWYMRRIMKISWTEKKSNKEVMEIA